MLLINSQAYHFRCEHGELPLTGYLAKQQQQKKTSGTMEADDVESHTNCAQQYH